MKKLWMIPVLALTLAACGNDDTVFIEEEEPVEMVETNEKGEEIKQDSPEETETEENKGEVGSLDASLAGFEESAILGENLPLEQLTSDVEEDNQNKRIILFENEAGEKVYKSIFIKENEHLKIIDIANDQENGLIFEGNL